MLARGHARIMFCPLGLPACLPACLSACLPACAWLQPSCRFKKIGIVLVKQDPDEAKSNVGRRLEMIQGQIKDVDAAIKVNEEQGEVLRKRIMVRVWRRGRW